MQTEQVVQIFTAMGGEFVTSPILLSERLPKIKLLLFDWDGVWHNGRKQGDVSSFSEVDSMGLNLLRFGYWLNNGKLPFTLIITGEQNQTAFQFANREHFDAVFYRAKNKVNSFEYILKTYGLKADEVLFVFDDVLDLAVAERCGVRMLIGRKGSPLLRKTISSDQFTDYISACDGGNNGVREVCELALGLLGNFETVVQKRMHFHADYAAYWDARNTRTTTFYTAQAKDIIEKHPIF